MMRVRAILLASALYSAATAKAQAPDPAVSPAPDPSARPEPAPAEPPTAPLPVTETPSSGDQVPMVEAMPAEKNFTEAEMEQLGFSATSPTVDTSLKLSGFMDFSVVSPVDKSTRALIGRPAFAIGNLNVYLSKNLTESFRTMAEIRFSYLPDGAPESMISPARTSTTTIDYADMGRASVHWGGIEIERVYLEWTANQHLIIRGGSFLTPYGIWNVDHGTPTIISAQRPYVIGAGFFPERQTGLELFGLADVGNEHTFGYHLTLSNGAGPFTEYLEFDRNKAVGGRAYWEYRKLGVFKLGASIYYGRDTSLVQSATLVNGAPQVKEKVTSQFDRLALAADLSWQHGGFLAQAEVVAKQTKYTKAGRYAAFSLADFQTHYVADNMAWGGYLLLGYRFDWGGIMPYVVAQRLENVQDVDVVNSTPLMVGLNMRPVDAVAFKLEYMHVLFDDGNVFPTVPLKCITAQAAWAF